MKINQIYENEWVYPTMKYYRMVCCDCGLAHAMDFEVVMLIPTGKTSKDNRPLLKMYPVPQIFGVKLRARRDNKWTKKTRKEEEYGIILRPDKNAGRSNPNKVLVGRPRASKNGKNAR